MKTNTKRKVQISIFMVALCVLFFSSGDIFEKRYRGKYVAGFEVSVFYPCESNQRWWVESDSSSLFEREFSKYEVPEDIFKVRSLYVEWIGKKSFLGSYGHLGHSNREIWVTGIEKVKHYENECGDRMSVK